VKLLFDENVSPRLVGLLEDEYPGSTHLRRVADHNPSQKVRRYAQWALAETGVV
jgi:predicted nuclease of predicted toxin-antitoxin system